MANGAHLRHWPLVIYLSSEFGWMGFGPIDPTFDPLAQNPNGSGVPVFKMDCNLRGVFAPAGQFPRELFPACCTKTPLVQNPGGPKPRWSKTQLVQNSAGPKLSWPKTPGANTRRASQWKTYSPTPPTHLLTYSLTHLNQIAKDLPQLQVAAPLLDHTTARFQQRLFYTPIYEALRFRRLARRRPTKKAATMWSRLLSFALKLVRPKSRPRRRGPLLRRTLRALL